MEPEIIRYEDVATGQPYHAARRRASDLPHGQSPAHGHAGYAEAFLLTDGTVIHHVNGAASRLVRGNIALVGEHDVHSFERAGDYNFTLTNVAVPTSTWRQLAGLSGVGLGVLDAPTVHPPAFVLAEQFDELAALFGKALHQLGPDAGQLIAMKIVLGVLEAVRSGTQAARPSAAPSWLLEAQQAMNDEANLRAGVDRMAELAAVSRSQLARMMRRWFGQSPIEFVIQLKMARAQTLLSTTDLTIAAVARRCGFTNAAYFSRQFAQLYGVPPRTYREHRRRTAARMFGITRS